MLHFDAQQNSQTAPTSDDEIRDNDPHANAVSTASVTTLLASLQKSALLATAVIIVRDRCGNSLSARALIDPGEQRSFISERLAAQLSSKRRAVSIGIFGIGGHSTSRARGELPIALRSRIDSAFECNCTALILSELTGLLPLVKISAKEWTHLQDLPLADPHYHTPGKIILREGLVRGKKDAPIAQNTTFGWILTGALSAHSVEHASPNVTAFHTVTEPSLDEVLSRFWEIKEIPTTASLFPSEEYCDQYFFDTYSRNEQSRFVVRLSFAQRETFPGIRDIAVVCLHRSEKRSILDPSLQQAHARIRRTRSHEGCFASCERLPLLSAAS